MINSDFVKFFRLSFYFRLSTFRWKKLMTKIIIVQNLLKLRSHLVLIFFFFVILSTSDYSSAFGKRLMIEDYYYWHLFELLSHFFDFLWLKTLYDRKHRFKSFAIIFSISFLRYLRWTTRLQFTIEDIWAIWKHSRSSLFETLESLDAFKKLNYDRKLLNAKHQNKKSKNLKENSVNFADAMIAIITN